MRPPHEIRRGQRGAKPGVPRKSRSADEELSHMEEFDETEMMDSDLSEGELPASPTAHRLSNQLSPHAPSSPHMLPTSSTERVSSAPPLLSQYTRPKQCDITEPRRALSSLSDEHSRAKTLLKEEKIDRAVTG